MLHGGYGALNGVEAVTLIWKGLKQTREALGIAATRALYLSKLDQPSVFNIAKIRRDTARLSTMRMKRHVIPTDSNCGVQRAILNRAAHWILR